jgi:hypothetical protein
MDQTRQTVTDQLGFAIPRLLRTYNALANVRYALTPRWELLGEPQRVSSELQQRSVQRRRLQFQHLEHWRVVSVSARELDWRTPQLSGRALAQSHRGERCILWYGVPAVHPVRSAGLAA